VQSKKNQQMMAGENFSMDKTSQAGKLSQGPLNFLLKMEK
jgi:hypothetical protein